jgi:hypothetical protein
LADDAVRALGRRGSAATSGTGAAIGLAGFGINFPQPAQLKDSSANK